VSVFVGIVSLALVFLIIWNIVSVDNVKNNIKKIKELKSAVYGDGFKTGLQERISDLEETCGQQKETLRLLIEGLPNLYKDDIDLVRKVDYPSKVKSCITQDINSNDSLIVVFLGKDKYFDHYPQSLGSVIRRAAEIRKVQEKCCPKKGKKK